MPKSKKDWENCERCIFNGVWADTGGCPFAYDQCDGKKMFREYKPLENKTDN